MTNVTALNSGNYTVIVNANNCATSAVKNITVNSTTPPKAGQDNTIIYCGSQGNINLENLIIGPFDVGGIWTETTSSGGIITSNTWNSSNVISGNYQFTYKVIGGCNQSDESVVSIKIDPILPNPMIDANNNLCDGEVLQFNSDLIAGANYSWSGPNGFISNAQNPSINNCTNINSGNYFLTVNRGSCSSTNAINIAVAPKVEFDLNAGCNNGNYVVKPIPIANSYNPINSSFYWSGPKNFVSNQEEVILSGSASIGEFNLTITNSNGCSASRKVNVTSTACSIQNGISPNNDGKNENFDLSGLGQDVNLEIFNRYGTKVFWQDDYSNQWHGQDYNDNLLPDATYFYLVKLADNQVKTGWVYLTKDVR